MKSISVVLPVLAPTPFLQELAKFSIRTLRMQSKGTFELIVCEASPTTMNIGVLADKYLPFVPPIGGVKEINAGLAAADGEYILMTGTDIIPPADWDVELLRLFDDYEDCGAASLSAYEPNATIGPPHAMDLAVEGMFSPFMMVRASDCWRFDEGYQRIYQDSDLILRMYTKRQRAYRSCRKHVWHLGSVTNTQAGQAHIDAHNKALAHDERLFYSRWGNSPLSMFGMIRAGHQVYGREHEPLTCPINLHFDPNAPEG